MTRCLPGCLILAILAANLNAGQEGLPKKGDTSPKSNTAPTINIKKSANLAEKAAESNPSHEDQPLRSSEGKTWLSPDSLKELGEHNRKLREQIDALEKKLKKDKVPPSACKLSGRLDGDVATLHAEILFATTAAQTTVFIGLKNGFLLDEGRIDDGVPHIESTEDGFIVHVEKAGAHRLSLDMRVPVVVKRTISSAPGNDRGFDLGLPGAAVTTLMFDLPVSAKELRCNDNLLAPKTPGHWDIVLGAPKSLVVIWKEPAATASAVAGPSARANLKVKLEESRIEIAGELVLEDAKNPRREWRLLLPPQIKVTPAAGSPEFMWTPPEDKSNVHTIRAAERAEKITLSLQAQFARTLPQQKLPVGPVLVEGTSTQGTILVQAVPGVQRSQGPAFHRFGEIFQSDPPKSPPGVENLAQFQFWNAPFSGKGLSKDKTLLELEWKTEKGQVDAVVEHDIKVRDNHGQWLIDVESRFLVKSANFRVETLDMQTPTLSFPDFLWLAVETGGGFPAALRWPVALTPRPAFPLSLTVLDDQGIVDLPPVDSQRRVRLALHRPIGQEMLVKAQSRLLGPGDVNRFRIELPKLVGVLDRGAKVTVWAPLGQELLIGPPNQREPVQDKYEQTFEQMPTVLDLAWRSSQREKLARSIVDLTVREHMLHVRQTMLLPTSTWSGGATQTGQLALRLPTPGFMFSAVNVARLSQDKSLAWIKLPPASKDFFEIQFEFDIPIAEQRTAAGTVVPLLWPDAATNREAKVRVWTEPGMTPTLVGLGSVWKARPIEEGPNFNSWPSLVAAAIGPVLPLTVMFEQTAEQRLPTLLAERSLIEVRIEDDGAQTYRCRFWVRKFSATALDVDLPVPWDQGSPHVRINGKEVGGVSIIDPLFNRVRIPLVPHLYPQPVSFEIEYRIPKAQVDGKRFWQTPLSPPRFQGEVAFGLTRWQVALPANQTSFVFGPTTVDYHWILRGWLLSPEPSVTAAELDTWIHAAEASEVPPSLTWWRNTVDRQRIYHVPRQVWLVVCSGTALVLGLLVLLTPLPRIVIGIVVMIVGFAMIALGLMHEYLLPVLMMGCEPGIAVLMIVAAIQWALQERYRRQLVFMPTFSRVPPSSTVVRNQSKPPRDPSTIDAPVTGTGSVKSTGH